MGKLLFGNDETITCIQHVDVRGPKDEPLCIAYKTTKVFVGAGVYLKDDGYVLGTEKDSTHYFELSADRTAELQTAGLLPKPLPAYAIPWYEYAFGYSLWLVIAGVVVAMAIGSARRKRRQAEDAATPTSFGPPVLATDVDRFIDAQVRPLLEPGEAVMHQAYTLSREPGGGLADATAEARYAALTARRLFLFTARVGAFGPLKENRGTEIIPRDRIASFVVEDRSLHLQLDDGSTRLLWVGDSRKLSNQRAFLRDVPRILGGALPAGAATIAASA